MFWPLARFIELSHKILPGMTTYPGLPVPKADLVFDHEESRSRYQDKAEFLIANLHLCGNTGGNLQRAARPYAAGEPGVRAK